MTYVDTSKELVKVRFSGEFSGEWMWVRPIRQTESTLLGRLANDPFTRKDIQHGDVIEAEWTEYAGRHYWEFKRKVLRAE